MAELEQLKILAFAGSTRAGSYNKKLAKIAAQGAQQPGVETTLLDLRDYPLPLFDQDWEDEHGLPENAHALRALLKSHQGWLLGCPEYNSAITAVLKNMIDWASRPVEGEPPLACFTGKVAAIMSASPGALGGLRGLSSVRSILENLGVLVLPTQVAIPKAHEAFNEQDELKDPKQQASILKLGQSVAELSYKLNLTPSLVGAS